MRDYDDEYEEYETSSDHYEDEDYCRLVCPCCEQLVYFGDYLSSKKMCAECLDKKREDVPLKPLIDLVEATLHQDVCGDA